MEIEVDYFVSECGEFVAEAKLVFPFSFCGPGVAVILFFNIFIQSSAVRGRQLHIDVIIATGYYLEKKLVKKL